MADVRITWKGDKLLEAMTPALNKGLTAAALVAANYTVESVLSKHPSPPAAGAGEPPGYDTGTLRNSIAFASPEKLGTPLHAAYGTALRYGRMLEFGGTITAKGKALAVPMPSPEGRKLAQRVLAQGGGKIRGNPNLVLIKTKNGAFLALKDKLRLSYGARLSRLKGGRKSETFPPGTLVFALKKRVTIKAHPWIRRAADNARPQLQEAFVQTAKAELIKAGVAQA